MIECLLAHSKIFDPVSVCESLKNNITPPLIRSIQENKINRIKGLSIHNSYLGKHHNRLSSRITLQDIINTAVDINPLTADDVYRRHEY